MKFITKNIFLDTNIYEENNFFHSNNIQSLFYYSKIGVIKLYMTTISKMEFIERMKKGLIDAKEEHNKLVSFINKSRILRNLSKYEKIEKSKIKVEKSISELTDKLNVIINTSSIKMISADNINIEEIFELYYKKEPPFSISGKKFEFPDAFIIKSIETWCKQNRKKMIFVTKDSDFSNYKSSHLLFRDDLSGLLSDISAYYDTKQKNQFIPFIEDNLRAKEAELVDLIDIEIDSNICFDVDFEKTSNIKREKVKFVNYKISSIRPQYAEVTYNVELDFSCIVFPSEIDFKRSVFHDNLMPKRYSFKKIISCDLEVNLKRKNDIKLKWINSNQKLLINFEK